MNIEMHQWFPDNQKIALLCWDTSGSSHIYSVDINQPTLQKLTANDQSEKFSFSLSEDGKGAFYWHQYFSGGTLWEIELSKAY